MDQGEDVMSLDTRGRMPLHWAAGFNSLEMVSLLVEAGSEVHGFDNYRYTPLQMAVADSDVAVAAFLLDNGAQLHAADAHGETPLAAAMFPGRAMMVEMLLDRGADIRWVEDNGYMLLHKAAFVGAADVIEVSLERGLDPDVRIGEGFGDPPVHCNHKRQLGVCEGAVGAWRQHLQEGQKTQGWIPLHHAVSYATASYAYGTAIETARLLLERGSDVGARDHEGRTPLHLAVTHDGEDDGYRDLAAMFGIDRPPVEAVDMVAFLLDWGADIEARNGDGETPLLTAAGGTRTPDVVRLLLARGADVSAKNTWGRTACDMAVPMGGWSTPTS